MLWAGVEGEAQLLGLAGGACAAEEAVQPQTGGVSGVPLLAGCSWWGCGGWSQGVWGARCLHGASLANDTRYKHAYALARGGQRCSLRECGALDSGAAAHSQQHTCSTSRLPVQSSMPSASSSKPMAELMRPWMPLGKKPPFAGTCLDPRVRMLRACTPHDKG